MEAKPAGPSAYIEINHICDGCVLHKGHEVSPSAISVGRPKSGQMETQLEVSSQNGEVTSTNFRIPGILRRDQVVERFNSPADVQDGGPLACNALCAVLTNIERQS